MDGVREEFVSLVERVSATWPPGAQPLIEPLSNAEVRVLRYLPTHLSMPEIAGELSVSLNTVRTHMRHLYAKLGTHRRAETVHRARALGLLAPARLEDLGQRQRFAEGGESHRSCEICSSRGKASITPCRTPAPPALGGVLLTSILDGGRQAASRMSRATRLRFTVSPRPITSSAWTRGHQRRYQGGSGGQ